MDYNTDTYTLKCTCHACPEQYDVFKNGDMEHIVGYLRLRHGTFRVAYPDAGEPLIYEGYPDGDGIFGDEERPIFLHAAVQAIHDACGGTEKFSFILEGNNWEGDLDYYQ